MANPFVHVELNTSDLAQAKAFYGKLLATGAVLGLWKTKAK